MESKKFTLKSLLNIKVIGAIVILFVISLISWKVSEINQFVGVPDKVGYIAGFWSGLWDGICSPATALWNGLSLDDNVYNSHNCGISYPFAFLLPVATFMYVLVARWIAHANDM